MNRYFLPLLLVCNFSAAQEFHLDINLYNPNPSYSLVSSTNAQMTEDNNLLFWEGINKSLPSEIIYKISTPEIMSFSAFKSNSVLNATTMADFLGVYTSSNGSNWKQLDFASLSKPYRNFTRDSTFGSWRQQSIYFRGYFSGDVKYLISNNETNDTPYLLYIGNTIPEPATFVLIAICLFSFSFCRLGNSGFF